MNLDMILEPEKVLKFGEIEVHIKGTKPTTEMYIEELMFKKYKDEKDANAGGREYIKRLISCSVKEVKGLSINDKPFVLKFKDSPIEEIDDESYEILLRVFDSYIKQNMVDPIIEFYKQNKEGVSGVTIQEDESKKA